jgi:TRAP-type transport system small permease protein
VSGDEGGEGMKALRKILEGSTTIIFGCIIMLTLLQIATRYFSLASLPWTEEIARLLLVWATYFSVSIVIGRRDHIQIDFVYLLLPRKYKLLVDIMIEFLFLAFSFVAMYFGYLVVQASSTDHNTSLKYSSAFFYLPIPICGALNLFFISKNVSTILKRATNGETLS